MALKTIETQLTRLGDTEFTCGDLQIETAGVYFIPTRELNELRRGAMQNLAAVRSQNRPESSGKIEKNAVPFPESHLSYRANVANQKAADFYRRHGAAVMEPALEVLPAPERDPGALSGKPVMLSRYCILHELGLCRKTLKNRDIDDPLTLVDETGRRLTVKTDCNRCEMELYLEKN